MHHQRQQERQIVLAQVIYTLLLMPDQLMHMAPAEMAAVCQLLPWLPELLLLPAFLCVAGVVAVLVA